MQRMRDSLSQIGSFFDDKESSISTQKQNSFVKRALVQQQQDSGYIEEDEVIESRNKDNVEEFKQISTRSDVDEIMVDEKQDDATIQHDLHQELQGLDQISILTGKKGVNLLISPTTQRKCAIADYFFMEHYFDKLRYLNHRKQRLLEFQQNATTHNWNSSEYSKEWKKFCAQESAFLRTRRARTKAGQFKILAQIGQGGYGEVFLAQKNDTNEICALKRINKKSIVRTNEQHHILSERDILVDMAGNKSNKWTAKLLYSFQDTQFLYFAMEFVPGGDLRSFLNSSGILRENDAIFFIAEICVAVDELHRFGYIHRDLKPENFMIDGTGHLKLIDFGLSKGGADTYGYSEQRMDSMRKKFEALNNAELSLGKYNSLEKIGFYQKQQERLMNTRAFSLVGSPDYMAAEILLNASHSGKTGVYSEGYDYLVDYWSIGCMYFEFLAEFPPFAAPTTDEVWVNLYYWQEVLERPVYKGKDEEFNLSDNSWNFINTLIAHRHTRSKSIDQIQAHKLFKSFNDNIEKAMVKYHQQIEVVPGKCLWSYLRDFPSNTIKPPFIPNLRHETDISHFDDFNSPAALAMYKDIQDRRNRNDGSDSDIGIHDTRSVFTGFSFKHQKAVDFRRVNV